MISLVSDVGRPASSANQSSHLPDLPSLSSINHAMKLAVHVLSFSPPVIEFYEKNLADLMYVYYKLELLAHAIERRVSWVLGRDQKSCLLVLSQTDAQVLSFRTHKPNAVYLRPLSGSPAMVYTRDSLSPLSLSAPTHKRRTERQNRDGTRPSSLTNLSVICLKQPGTRQSHSRSFARSVLPSSVSALL